MIRYAAFVLVAFVAFLAVCAYVGNVVEHGLAR